MERRDDATFLNVSIADAKHFPELAPINELFSELATSDGCALFECAELVKATGVDLMDCPLQLNLKLHVRRRLPEGAALLWHMILPLAVISKNLLQPPHEWDTWLGLLPANQNLEMYAPEMMFAQAVIHLLAKPEYPKLRLQFKYHNPALRAKMALQKQTEQERRQEKELQAASYGQQQFQNLQLGGLLEKRSVEKVAETAMAAGVSPLEAEPALLAASEVTSQGGDSRESRLSEALASCLQLLSEMQSTRSTRHGISDPLTIDRISTCDAPEQLVRSHFQPLTECQEFPMDEKSLADSLQYALLGALDDFGAESMGSTSGLSGISEPTSQLLAVRERFPLLWPICRQVSKLANDRVRLMEEIEASADGPNVVQENARLRTELVEAHERYRKGEEELSRLQARVNDLTLALSRGQSPEIDLL